MKQSKATMLLDILCYFVIPYFIWTYGREPLGDYYALLLSTVPGIVYTGFRFVKYRQFNLLGFFIISSLLVTTTINLISSTAETMLWNQVYVGFVFASLFLLSIFFRRPLALYFAADVAALQGISKKESIQLFSQKTFYRLYQGITLLFVLRGVVQNGGKAWLLSVYGVDGYHYMLIYLQISGWLFTGLIIASFLYVGSKVNKYLSGEAA
ncbi:VC0807 family protein [Alkalihalobacterium bogoriense]|uniref:VC0807 family protein n=1 Tax=Alkalihalobacterium bogoriense TaxID=246272 RepID=UPI0005548EC5|nr:VC0807 family protein [Alkalihalobacterium bogoriense]